MAREKSPMAPELSERAASAIRVAEWAMTPGSTRPTAKVSSATATKMSSRAAVRATFDLDAVLTAIR